MTMAMTLSHRQRASEDLPLEARANVYDFLATVLTSRATQGSVGAVRNMAQLLSIPCPDAWPLDELGRDYGALFVVPGPRYVAPYESVYRDAWQVRVPPDAHASASGAASKTVKGLLMGDSTLEVQRCYSEAGVLPEREIPDHVGNELRFMAYLSRRRSDAVEDDARLADLQAHFRDEHLLKWLDPLGDRIRESEHAGFYSLVVRIAEVVVQNDD